MVIGAMGLAAPLLAALLAQSPCAGTERVPSGKREPAEIAALEARIEAAPEDAEARAGLVSEYARQSARDPGARGRALPHLLWLVTNCPRAAVLGTPIAGSMVAKDAETYHQVRALWLAAIDRNPQDTRVMLHTALFVGVNELGFARQLLERATAADAGCERCWAQFGHVLELLAHRTGAEETQALYGRALEAHERALALAGSERERFYGLAVAAKVAVAAGALDRARALARELLDLAPKYKDDWNHGNAIHHGNLLLGRVALREGRLDLARQHLLAAGKTPGSPQLAAFGPSLGLAQELLDAGEAKAVREYLDRCRKFWKRGRAQLKAWSEQIKQGERPDFGANALY